MAGPGLSTNNDATYGDSPTDPAVKKHQQDHDAIAGVLNKFDTATPLDGQILTWSEPAGLWVGAALPATGGGTVTTIGPGAYTATARTPESGDQTIYVDPTSGAGTATGTLAAPYKTASQLNGASLAAGAVVYLKRGTTLTGAVNIAASGTAAKPITITAYGTGAQPVITSNQSGDPLTLGGAWIDAVDVCVSNGSFAGVVLRGADCGFRGGTLTGSCAGIQITGVRAKVLGNQITNNNQMSVNTPSPNNDDSGAFGVLINAGGDRAEVGYNEITGHLAASYDYGSDGCAVEIYGASAANVHHNLAAENETFCELGSPNITGNSFTYNVIRASSYTSAKAIVTRGSGDTFGPVLATTFSHNSVYFTGGSSEGIIAYANPGQNILTAQYNAIKVGGSWCFVDDGPHTEDHNVFSGPINFAKHSTSVQGDPLFVSATDLHPQAGSPALTLGAGAYS